MLYMYAIWVVYGYYMDDMCNIHMLKNKKSLEVSIFHRDVRDTRDTHLEDFPEF